MIVSADCMSGGSTWNNSCYFFVHTKMTWENAKCHCYSYDNLAHLVFIESDRENEFVLTLINRKLIAASMEDVWMGLVRDEGSK